MNIFNIIISKVSATISVIMITLGLSQAPIITISPISYPVEVATTTDTFLPEVTKTIDVVKTNVVTVSAIVLAPTTTPEVIATSTPVIDTSPTTTPVVTPVTLPTYQVATSPVVPVTQPVVIIQVQQPVQPVIEPTPQPVSIATSQPMETLFQITKDGAVIKDSLNEQAVRDFASDLNEQINWKKCMQSYPLFPVTEGDQKNVASGLLSNSYVLTQK